MIVVVVVGVARRGSDAASSDGDGDGDDDSGSDGGGHSSLSDNRRVVDLCLAAYLWWYGVPLGSSERLVGGLGVT